MEEDTEVEAQSGYIIYPEACGNEAKKQDFKP